MISAEIVGGSMLIFKWFVFALNDRSDNNENMLNAETDDASVHVLADSAENTDDVSVGVLLNVISSNVYPLYDCV